MHVGLYSPHPLGPQEANSPSGEVHRQHACTFFHWGLPMLYMALAPMEKPPPPHAQSLEWAGGVHLPCDCSGGWGLSRVVGALCMGAGA